MLTPASLARSPDRNAFPACSNPLSIEYAPWNRFQGQEKNESRCDSDFKDRGNRNERCASGNDADASGHEENSGQSRTSGPAILFAIIALTLCKRAMCSAWGLAKRRLTCLNRTAIPATISGIERNPLRG